MCQGDSCVRSPSSALTSHIRYHSLKTGGGHRRPYNASTSGQSSDTIRMMGHVEVSPDFCCTACAKDEATCQSLNSTTSRFVSKCRGSKTARSKSTALVDVTASSGYQALPQQQATGRPRLPWAAPSSGEPRPSASRLPMRPVSARTWLDSTDQEPQGEVRALGYGPEAPPLCGTSYCTSAGIA